MEDCDYWFAPSPHHQYFTSLLEEFQLEQLAVETFPVEVSFSLSFLLASSSAAATSMVLSERRDIFTYQH